MKILVIGGTRFIGAFTVRRLVEMGHEVAVFHRGRSAHEILPDIEHIQGDRNKLVEFKDRFRQFAPDVVLDSFALTEHHAQTFVEVFKGLTGRSVVLSSGDVYRAFGVLGRTEDSPIQPVPLKEDAPLRKKFYPGRGQESRADDDPDQWVDDYDKILVERIVRNETDLPTTILRLPAVYGPGDHRPYPYLKRMMDGRKVILLGEDLARWRFQKGYVENVAAAIALAVTDSRVEGKIYNIGEPDTLSEVDWIRAIGAVVGWEGKIATVPKERLPDHLQPSGNTAQDLVYNTELFREQCNYTEHIVANEGLKRTLDWERANPPENIDDTQFNYEAEDQVIAELGLHGG
ncbi:MAG: NAD-dependent epimerase/dehydratase family protein [Candidatus Latescibacteria bacterium]|nr:NAD-dependent epimerase/dehydratase family protein [Candidatus Latescibacterota bacterium]